MPDANALAALGVKVHTLAGHHPFVLEDASRMWIVRSGSAEVLCSATQDHAPVGARRVLFRVGPRDTLFPVRDDAQDSSIRVMLLPIQALELLEVPVDRLEDVCAALGTSCIDAVEDWAIKLASFLAVAGPPTSSRTMPAEGELQLEADQTVRVEPRKVSWLRVDQGSACLLGLVDLTIENASAHLPLSGDLWLQATEATQISTVRADSLGGQDALCAGLRRLHALLLRRLIELTATGRQDEMVRLENREQMQRRRATGAIEAMHSVLEAIPTIKPRESPLLTAMSLVGAELGVDIAPPPKSENLSRVKNEAEAIARASRVRHRKILLRGMWWKSDCGPIVGFLKEGHRPVALLRGKHSAYDIVDPNTGSRKPVTAQTMMALEPDGIMIYRRLPDALVRPAQLAKFLLRGRGGDVMFVVVLATFATLIGMLTPLATAVVMDQAIPGADLRLLVELGLILFAAAIGTALFRLAQGIVSVRMAISTETTALASVWDRLLKLQVSFFRRFSSGDLLSRISALSEVSREMNGATVQSLLAALMSLLNFGLLLLFSVRLAVIAAVLAVAVALITIIGGYFIHNQMRRLIELRGRFFGMVVQMINSASKIRVAGAQERAFTTWCKGYSEQLTLVNRTQFTQDLVAVFNLAVPMVSTVLLYWVGTDLVTVQGRVGGVPTISIGVFLAFSTAMATFLSGVTALSMTVVSLLETVTKIKRVGPVLEALQEVNDSKVDPGRLEGSVSLAHVDFRYVEGGRKILDDVTLGAEPGEFVALVGPSGSGKSTIFRILLGFEMPESGTVAYDGQDLAGLDTHAVRRQLGVVLQAGRIAAGSLLEHISAGAQVSLEEAWDAVDAAGLGDDLRAMPMGLHTILSEGGGNISGGQRQRLLIARALVARPKILLMDEATSALDNTTQAIVTESLKRRRVTRLVIAHRLSTIRDADRIFVLDRGCVVESGTFDELSKREGLFAAMMARQRA